MDVPFPYETLIWDRLCFGTGDTLEPQPSASNAQEALNAMPPGTRFRVLVREVPAGGHDAQSAGLWALQVTDASAQGRLGHERALFPTLWARFDATAPRADLTSYTRSLGYCTLELAPREIRERAEVVILVTPQNQPLAASELPLVTRRV